jgi:hypothetical protein
VSNPEEKVFMQIFINWIFAIIPLAIGINALSNLKGWTLIRPDDPQYSKEWVRKNRRILLGVAILSTSAGIACILKLVGALDGLLAWLPTLEEAAN